MKKINLDVLQGALQSIVEDMPALTLAEFKQELQRVEEMATVQEVFNVKEENLYQTDLHPTIRPPWVQIEMFSGSEMPY